MNPSKGEKFIRPGDVISYMKMCSAEDVNLQRGMNFRLKGGMSVILMSLRAGAPYNDKVEDDGKVLIYEGHDIAQTKKGPNAKAVDQPMANPSGTLTQNGLFFLAAENFKKNIQPTEKVKVYEKIKPGIWVYNGIFNLIDAFVEKDESRNVFKFKLEIDEAEDSLSGGVLELEYNRMIPSSVKLKVWKRDKGRCVECGKPDNLHFDHIIPFSKGGSSLVVENIQILCARHNLQKRDKIQ
jgi:HNH endonuclease